MTPRDVDHKLVEILSEYYPEVGAVVARARRAGVDTEQIDTSGAAIDVWVRVVQWARTRRKTMALIDEARADFDTDELRALKVQEMGQADQTRAIDNVGEMLSAHLDSLRSEMYAMERRLNDRISGVEEKIDTLKSISTVYSPKKRNAWLIAFVLFCLPFALVIFEVRQAIGVSPSAAIGIMGMFWLVACGFFMYALGFVRDL